MTPNQMQRPVFFEEQFLDADDLTAAVDYARTQQARFLLGAHTWGIAVGLQLREMRLPNGRVDVYLMPGYAWDGYGRPIVVLAPYRIPEEKFVQFISQPGTDPEGQGQRISVWLRYEEKESSFSNVFGVSCEASSKASRVQETFAIEAGNLNENELTSGVNVGGRLLTNPNSFLREFDASATLVHDESVPYQNFPGFSARARWLIPIGFVRWLQLPNVPGHFVPRVESGSDPDSDQIRRVRRYVGVVAEQIEAADGAIRLRNRINDPSKSSFTPPSLRQTENDLVWVEGNLRTEGDNRICGGSIDFRDAAGSDFDVPMRISRDDTRAPNRALNVLIGPEVLTSNRFAVGVQGGDGFNEKFVITSGGNVGIGTKTPTDHLDIVGNMSVSGLARKLSAGGWTVASDARLKRNVEQVSDALDLLLQLRGVRFEWKDTDMLGHSPGSQFGLVAQEVEKVFPEWVSKDPNGYRELTLSGFEALVVEALRELKSDVDELRSRSASSKKTTTRKKTKAETGKAQATTKA